MKKIYRIFLILSLPVFILFAANWGILPKHDSAGYFNFADKRLIWGIPHFGDVISNLMFIVAGIIGSMRLLMQTSRLNGSIKVLFWILSFGLIGVGIGSAYFHWDPNASSLLWDRLPIACCFAAILSLALADYSSSDGALILFVFLLLLSVLSVINIDLLLQDLRPYIVVQFGSLVIIMLVSFLNKGHYLPKKTLFLILGLYGSAKAFEIYDWQIYEQLYYISGHNLKHIAAALASILIFAQLK